jgi:[acyl-carrier-protein] S-malonyltransferase
MESARKEKEARRARQAAKANGTVRCKSARPAASPRYINLIHVSAPPSQASITSAPVDNTPVAFLFPGQGSQALGMLSSVKDLPAVRAMLSTANRVLGYDLLEMCTNGAFTCLNEHLGHRIIVHRIFV